MPAHRGCERSQERALHQRCAFPCTYKLLSEQGSAPELATPGEPSHDRVFAVARFSLALRVHLEPLFTYVELGVVESGSNLVKFECLCPEEREHPSAMLKKGRPARLWAAWEGAARRGERGEARGHEEVG